MLAGIKAMKASGVQILLVNGKDIQEAYANAGRSVRPGRGIMHSKTILVADRADFSNENYVIIGSTNWTISSLCNFETSMLLQLSQRGARKWHENIMSWPSVKLTADIEAETERSRSRTSSPSSAR